MSADLGGNGSAGPRRPRVVIVGGGFAGLYATLGLRRAPVDITVVDRRNHHLFQPLLYQVATAALDASQIAVPIRRILRRQKNTEVVLAEVTGIDVAAKRVELVDGALEYDHLILATGSTHSYFGHPDWEPWSPGLKTIEDALEIRRRMLLAFEAAEREQDPARRAAWLTFVIVGAGPTGVELAGALAEISRHLLARDFHRLGAAKARVLLVEAGQRVLSAFPESLSAQGQRDLEQLGVEVRLGGSVTDIDATGVTIGEERVETRTVLWAAGVAASKVARSLGAPLDRAGRVKVAPDLSVPGAPEVFVAGDLAAIVDAQGKPVPGVAPAAIQEGKHVAANVLRQLRGQPTLPFRYFDKGSLATIGRARAVADFGKLRLHGFFAWMAWLVVHIAYLIGFRNRLFVLVSWAWTYLTYDRGSRLITGQVGPLLEAAPEPRTREPERAPPEHAPLA
jgi:NADH dehydrogenase